MPAATLVQAQTDAKDETFIGKIGVALEEKCEAVLLEASNVPFHTQRFTYALGIVNTDPLGMARRLAWAVVAAGIPASSSDAAIRGFFSDSDFNILAGVSQ